MSRFFARSDSESETESSEDEQIIQKPPTLQASALAVSDDEEVVKRVVRSTREKRYEELTDLIKQIRNHKKIKDMAKILSTFENLTQAFTKAKPVIDKEDNGRVPNFYIRILVEMEDFVSECWEERKNMSKVNGRGLSTLKQRIKKYNKEFEKEISSWKENPVEEEAEEKADAAGGESDSDDSPADEKPSRPVKKVPKKPDDAEEANEGGEGDEDDDSDSSYWGHSSDETSSSESDDDKYADNLAAKFLKKTGDKDDKDRDRKRERKGRKEEKRRDDEEGDEDDEDDGRWQAVKGGVPLQVEKPKMFAKDAEINHQSVLKKLNEIVAVRGKKSTDRNEQIAMLSELLSIADQNNLGPAFQVKIMFAIISALFDYNLKLSPCMKQEAWHKTLSYTNQCLDDLFEFKDSLVIGENVIEENEVLNEAPYKVKGCILTIVEKMDEEFTKILQNADAHSPEYIERLKDEVGVCHIIERLQEYLELRGSHSELCRVYLRKIDHLYYKFDPKVLENEKGNSAEELNKLCKFIYAKDSTDRIRTQAILCHIYHSALHDRWYEARDLILMSHLQDSIQCADVATQILYNRALVQLGLCAFRHGNIRDAHNALLDIQSGGRAKEMLAQGLLPQRQQERTSEQEKIEKRRQMPFHKHINLELFECVYLVSAMLLEIPAIVAHELDGRKRMISKSFHYQLRNTERQPLVGPPESMREHVVAASKAMRVGNWRACRGFVINDKMNVKVWDLFHQADKVRAMIEQKVKEESLRTYIFMYSCVYDSLSLHTLAQQFELEFKTVHSIVSKMIIQDELAASIDEPNQMIVMHRSEPSRIQALALQLTDKVTQLIEHNEKLWDIKQGSYFGRNQPQGYRGEGGRDGRDRRDFRDGGGWGGRQNRRGDRRHHGGDRHGGDNYRSGAQEQTATY